ncbi:suppressor of fused domain protein [Mesorhizobium wenxiniae]|uniref:suppressor of fused domain protein n=1 Tax=Mesorhizobium wenxiniae TaxID=2014805 RepID=UPI003CCA618D
MSKRSIPPPLYGVCEFAPTPQRPFWLYVTSGHSNPWHEESDGYDPASQSGAGIEFIFASAERGDWATQCLQNLLAFDLLLEVGHFPGGQPLTEGDRIPIRSPINGKENCLIRNVILSRPASLPTGFQLPFRAGRSPDLYRDHR